MTQRKARAGWALHHSTTGSSQEAFEKFLAAEIKTIRDEIWAKALRERPFMTTAEREEWFRSGDWSWTSEEGASPASPAGTGSATGSGSTELALQAMDAAAEATLRSNSLSKKSGVHPGDQTAPAMPRRLMRDLLDRRHTSRASRDGRR